VANFIYKQAKADLVNGTHDWDDPAQTYKVLLVGTGYTPSALHTFVADVSAQEITGTGYVPGFAGSGRKAITARTVTTDPSIDRSELDGADVSWASINAGTAKAAIIYRHLTSDADSRVIAYIDSGGFPVVTAGSDLSISWNADGLIQLT
jgi:hypothetical protein